LPWICHREGAPAAAERGGRDKLAAEMDASPAPVSDARKGGCLYLVATPIGNLEDITVRALRILGEAHLIACEDTRQTAKLLRHYNIDKKTISYHEHNEMTRAAELVIRLEEGANVALVTDAGTPGISDPGHHLISLCLRHHIAIVPIPGPSAVIAALTASGLPTEEFLFVGFLPSRGGERRKTLERLAPESRTLVLYESPHRLTSTLADALELFGRRPAVIARELTKLHEEFLRGDLAELLVRVRQQPPRGEITLLIGAGAPGQVPASDLPAAPLNRRVEQIMLERNLDRKAALKTAARERGLSKREAYKQLLMDR
jgi:16S rRNA (cytidine1402-2'-O)-methyltransferase